MAGGSGSCAAHGFEIIDLVEPPVPATATAHEYYDFIDADWARRWPAEKSWVARLAGRVGRRRWDAVR